jgi:tetratricopeptide (TPR) repeat protein
MKKLYTALFILLSLMLNAQSNINVYKIEKEGNRLLALGKFSDALVVYESYRTINNGASVAELDKKIQNIRVWRNIQNDAINDFKAGRYISGIQKLKQYRSLFPYIRINSVDQQIENGLVTLERQKGIAKLDDKDRIIFGFEKNYLAETLLEDGEFSKAKSTYQAAIESVSGVKEKNAVKGQAEARIAQINRCEAIQNLINSKSTVDLKKQIDQLETYKTGGGIIVKTIETAISFKRLALESQLRPIDKTKQESENLLELTKNCNDLPSTIFFLQKSSTSSFETSRKDSLIGQLQRINQELTEIRTIKSSGDMLQRKEFVLGGYESLIIQSRAISFVGNDLSNCIQAEYFDFLYKTAKQNFDQESKDIKESRATALQAAVYARTESEKTKSTELLTSINNRIGCETIVSDQFVTLSKVNANLDGCLLVNAKDNLTIVKKYAAGCLTPSLSTAIQTAEKSIINLEKEKSIIEELKRVYQKHVEAGDCSQAESTLEEIRVFTACEQPASIRFADEQVNVLKECNRRAEFLNQLLNSKSQLSFISLVTDGRKINWDREEGYLKSSAKYLFSAELIARDLDEKSAIKQARSKITEAENAITKYRKAALKNENKYYTKITKPELYFASNRFSAAFSNENETINSLPTFVGNYEIGIHVLRAKLDKSLSSSYGVNVSRTNLLIADPSGQTNEELITDYITAEYRLKTGGKKNFRPYMSMGFGVNVPIQTSYKDNLIGFESKKNSFANTNVYSLASVGIEVHRKNIGASLEAFIKIAGFLSNENTGESIFPVYYPPSFRFARQSQSSFTSQAIITGIAITAHLW